MAEIGMVKSELSYAKKHLKMDENRAGKKHRLPSFIPKL